MTSRRFLREVVITRIITRAEGTVAAAVADVLLTPAEVDVGIPRLTSAIQQRSKILNKEARSYAL
jgi:hypothetical protein